jgi:hypothetical protein
LPSGKSFESERRVCRPAFRISGSYTLLLFEFRRPAHTLTIPSLQVGAPNQPPTIDIFFRRNTLSEDQSQNGCWMHPELPDCFARGEH